MRLFVGTLDGYKLDSKGVFLFLQSGAKDWERNFIWLQ